MLIIDLLNLVFDQSDYSTLTTLRTVNKRKTNYANKYSIMIHYDSASCSRKKLKIVEYAVNNSNPNDHAAKHKHPTCSKCIKCVMCFTCKCLTCVMYEKHLKHARRAEIFDGNHKLLSHNKIDIAFVLSAYNGCIEIVKYLVGIGANVHNGALLKAAMFSSVRKGHLETLKYIVSVGPNVHNDALLKAALLSSIDGNLEILKYLVMVGANIRDKIDYALILCVRHGHLEIAKYLVSIGANIMVDGCRLFDSKMVKDYFGHLRHTQ